MEPTPNTLEVVMQRALDILREYASVHGEVDGNFCIVSLQPAKVLYQNGISHTDTERAYSGLKRYGLITILKRGRGTVPAILRIQMDTSVIERRLENIAARRRGHKVSTNQALLDYYTAQENSLRRELDIVLQAKAEVKARMTQEEPNTVISS